MMKKNISNGYTRRAALGVGMLGIAACGRKEELQKSADNSEVFGHGIASGDPLVDRVILWTCVAKGGGELRWEIAENQQFSSLVLSGELMVPSGENRPVKVDAIGLQAGTEYFYRFLYDGATSDVGRTKTLALGPVEKISLAVVSCSNHPAGYFHSYAHIAKSDPVDAVLALGDYIYEYGLGGYATEDAVALGRIPEPEHECVTYEDYAMRYAQYHRDPDLQAAHKVAPWIMSWDDHETANDSWRGGAENHNPETQGDWASREAASLQAFYDWTATREPALGLPRTANYRQFDFGNLARLIMLETRLSGRSKPVDFTQFPVAVNADPDDPEVQEKLRIFETELLGDVKRRMLGDAQADFVETALQASVANGQSWQIIGNQTLFTELRSPDYMKELPRWLKWLSKRKYPAYFEYFQRSRFRPLLNLDSWDGYRAARERFYDKIKRAGANMLVVTGDTHDFVASTLRDQNGKRVGAELGTSGVSSPGNFSAVNAPGVDFGKLTEQANPDMLLHDAYNTGYIRMQVTADQVQADFISTSDVKKSEWSAKIAHQFVVTPDRIEKV